jgi:hypothetical protein
MLQIQLPLPLEKEFARKIFCLRKPFSKTPAAARACLYAIFAGTSQANAGGGLTGALEARGF